jgi:hypothetical protein
MLCWCFDRVNHTGILLVLIFVAAISLMVVIRGYGRPSSSVSLSRYRQKIQVKPYDVIMSLCQKHTSMHASKRFSQAKLLMET